MPGLSILQLNSLDAFRAHATSWDRLWARSDVTHPTAQAALVTQWIERFHDAKDFHAIVLCDRQRFVAALPLITTRKARVIDCMDIPCNEWSSAGQLMIDRDYDADRVCRCLVSELTQLPCSVLRFGYVPLRVPAWRALAEAARHAGMEVDTRHFYETGFVRTDGDWTSFRATWSKGFRRQLRKAINRLQRAGTLQLRREHPTGEQAVQRLLDRGLRMEHAGWKGANGSSVLATPGIRPFLERQAIELASRGQLELVFLDYNGRSIAFEYGWRAKGTFHSFKVAYDPAHARYSPGQVLTYFLLEQCFARDEYHTYDFLGPMLPAIASWRPTRYRIGRLLLAKPTWTGRAVLFATRHVMPQVRAMGTWRGRY